LSFPAELPFQFTAALTTTQVNQTLRVFPSIDLQPQLPGFFYTLPPSYSNQGSQNLSCGLLRGYAPKVRRLIITNAAQSFPDYLYRTAHRRCGRSQEQTDRCPVFPCRSLEPAFRATFVSKICLIITSME